MSEPFVYSVEKILFLTNDFPPQSGGIETFIEGLIRQLPKDSVVVHTSRQANLDLQDSFDEALFDSLGVIVVRDRQRLLLPNRGLLNRVAGTIHAHSIRTVVFGASVPLGLLAPRLRKLGVTRMIAITHGHEVWWSKLPIFKILLGRVARHVDHLTYLGAFTRAAISRVVEDQKKLIQLPPGVDVARFHPGEKPRLLLERYGLVDKTVILCVGRLVQRKGQDVLIQAMATIGKHHPQAHLVIAGSGNYERALQKLVKSAGVKSQVTFVGRVAFQELPELFRVADIFASPTRDRFGGLEVEGLGIVFLEASASGLPVIAGRSGGSPDAVQANHTGLVVDGKDVSAVAKALDELLANPELRISLGANGRQWMQRQWSWEVIGERFRQLLNLD